MSKKKERSGLGLVLLGLLVGESEPLIIQALFPSISYLAAFLLSISFTTLGVISVREFFGRKKVKFSIMEVKM